MLTRVSDVCCLSLSVFPVEPGQLVGRDFGSAFLLVQPASSHIGPFYLHEEFANFGSTWLVTKKWFIKKFELKILNSILNSIANAILYSFCNPRFLKSFDYMCRNFSFRFPRNRSRSQTTLIWFSNKKFCGQVWLVQNPSEMSQAKPIQDNLRIRLS